MPGGHYQMQFYTRYFIPLLIMMTGLPIPLIFWTAQYIFPLQYIPIFIFVDLYDDAKRG